MPQSTNCHMCLLLLSIIYLKLILGVKSSSLDWPQRGNEYSDEMLRYTLITLSVEMEVLPIILT